MIALRKLILIRRHVFGENKRFEWTFANFRAHLHTILDQWAKEISKAYLRDPEPEEVRVKRDNFNYNINYWKDIDYHTLRSTINDAYKYMRKLLHGKIRSELRASISEATRKRNENFKAGKLKSVLKPMLGIVPKIPLKLETLRVGDELLVDQLTIRDKVKEFFDDWFAEPADVNDRCCNLTVDQWLGITWEDFKIKMSPACIPEKVLEIIYKAISKRTEVKDLEEKQKQLLITPSFEEFSKNVDEARLNCAAGLSGLTNAMMKLWDKKLLRTVYDEIKLLWDRKEVPDFWRWSWLAPIPKVQDPELKDLRPLCFVETLQKAWISTFVKRIQKFWFENKILSDNQHGCLHRRSTSSALLQFIHTLETAYEHRSNVFIQSFDMSRAFDSVDKSLLEMAWARLHIPRELAKYIVDLDRDNNTAIRTPMAISLVAEYGHDMYEALERLQLVFERIRGTQQGGWHSLTWYLRGSN
jgi:hypothetical protein